VLACQPDDVVRFLLETSVLDRLCGPLADAVTGRDDSQELLERLERANLFLAPLDEVRGWWRYHRLFALLQARLAHQHPQRVAELHRAAAQRWDRVGPTRCGPWSSAEPAIRHALAGGDHDWAAALVERHFDAAFHRAEEATLIRWLAGLYDQVADQRPRLLAIRAFVSLMSGRPDEAERLLAAAERRLDDVASESFAPSVGRATSMVANLPAAVAIVRTGIARSRR
jgi:LuxR family maltose regulon positive regulatory protein